MDSRFHVYPHMTSLKMSNIFKDVTFHDSKKNISEEKKKKIQKSFFSQIFPTLQQNSIRLVGQVFSYENLKIQIFSFVFFVISKMQTSLKMSDFFEDLKANLTMAKKSKFFFLFKIEKKSVKNDF